MSRRFWKCVVSFQRDPDDVLAIHHGEISCSIWDDILYTVRLAYAQDHSVPWNETSDSSFFTNMFRICVLCMFSASYDSE